MSRYELSSAGRVAHVGWTDAGPDAQSLRWTGDEAVIADARRALGDTRGLTGSAGLERMSEADFHLRMQSAELMRFRPRRR